MIPSQKNLPVTVIVAVKNEVANIERCLGSLSPAERVIVVDSGSTDGTVALAANAGAEVVQFDFQGGYPKKRQWALDTLPLGTEWVFLLDADEIVPGELWDEIRDTVFKPDPRAAYLIRKGFYFLGRRFRFGGFSHQAILLFRRGKAHFEETLSDTTDGLDMEVHERLIVDGPVGVFSTPLIHEDFKGLEAYIARHNKYSTWEARLRHNYLCSGRYGEETVQPRLLGDAQQRRRFLKLLALRVPFEPILWFVYHYAVRLGFLEGRRGLIACQIRADYIRQVRAKMFELAQKKGLDR